MSFRREEFHGGRAYASDPPDKGERRNEDRASLIAWIKLQLGRLSGRSSRKMGEGFSLLGIDERSAQERELDTKVFPISHRRRNGTEAAQRVSSCE